MNSPGPMLKQIFVQALDQAPGLDRERFLDRACGADAVLREQVDTLLRLHDEADLFLDLASRDELGTVATDLHLDGPNAPFDPFAGEEAGPIAAPRPNIAERAGSVIGPYKLLQQIGEGGMGTVFMAEQAKPIRRKVALKVVKAGMDTRQVIARFDAERQALAMMDHPNIARVLDAGTTATGRPFFVMELVRGVPITEYCDKNQLTPRERLQLFLPVCRAIQHAHQKGIIHRDIKPSNVLVTLNDGLPEPKVIDFGVAKAVEQRLTERTMFTEFGAVIGTLEYMSPGTGRDGRPRHRHPERHLLPRRLALRTPHRLALPSKRPNSTRAAYSEALRRIREEEPNKPSTRLSESKDTLPTISAKRKTEPTKLSKLIRGDFDWIVMKSLDKDRTRRYETANGFARDIQRHLDGDAVEASPPSGPLPAAEIHPQAPGWSRGDRLGSPSCSSPPPP